MKHIPNKIYLQIGEDCPDNTDFENLGEATWNKDKVFSNDIEYVNIDRVIEAYRKLHCIMTDDSSCEFCSATCDIRKFMELLNK